MASDVDQFRAGLDRPTMELVDGIRAIVAACHPGLTEQIKWNAPSFSVGGEDRITLGIERKGGVRVVFHRGAKPLPSDEFSFVDDQNVARWPARDRGVVIFRDCNDFEQRAHPFSQLCTRWIAATS